MPDRLALVSLIVEDYDVARDWFERALGFSCVEDTPLDDSGKRWVVMRPGDHEHGASLLLARAAGPVQVAAIGQQGAGRVWLFLETDDFAARYAAMEQAGVKFVKPPFTESYGTCAVFLDICGNRWDLIQPSSSS